MKETLPLKDLETLLLHQQEMQLSYFIRNIALFRSKSYLIGLCTILTMLVLGAGLGYLLINQNFSWFIMSLPMTIFVIAILIMFFKISAEVRRIQEEMLKRHEDFISNYTK